MDVTPRYLSKVLALETTDLQPSFLSFDWAKDKLFLFLFPFYLKLLLITVSTCVGDITRANDHI